MDASIKRMIEELKQKFLKELSEGKLTEEQLKVKYSILFMGEKK